jgi:hypothetical protein
LDAGLALTEDGTQLGAADFTDNSAAPAPACGRLRVATNYELAGGDG